MPAIPEPQVVHRLAMIGAGCVNGRRWVVRHALDATQDWRSPRSSAVAQLTGYAVSQQVVGKTQIWTIFHGPTRRETSPNNLGCALLDGIPGGQIRLAGMHDALTAGSAVWLGPACGTFAIHAMDLKRAFTTSSVASQILKCRDARRAKSS